MWMNRDVSIIECDLKFAQTEGAFSGYGSVFGNIDQHGDIIMPGAFAEVLKTDDHVPAYVNHGWLRGDLPVGVWSSLKEDDRGLHGSAALVMQMPSAVDAYWGVKSGLVTGLSVAIIADKKTVERRGDGTRVIHHIKALKEISLVTDPANEAARVTDVKFGDDLDSIETVRELERFLRDAGGLSKAAATTLIARAKTLFGGGTSPDDVTREIAERLRRIALIV